MKLLVFLILLSIFSNSSYCNEPKKVLRSFNWAPLPELDTDTEKLFYDRNNSIQLLSNNTKSYNLGIILTVSKTPFPVDTETGTMMAQSLVTYVIIECNSGALSTGYRMFYDIGMPPVIGKPLSIKKYQMVGEGAMTVAKPSPLYDSLCPKTI